LDDYALFMALQAQHPTRHGTTGLGVMADITAMGGW